MKRENLSAVKLIKTRADYFVFGDLEICSLVTRMFTVGVSIDSAKLIANKECIFIVFFSPFKTHLTKMYNVFFFSSSDIERL